MEPEHLAFVLVVAVLAAGILLSGRGPETAADGTVGPPGSAHRHAHLFFVVNGSNRSLDDRYLKRADRVHFHGDDGILHVHADDLDLEYALDTLGIRVTPTCLQFGLENETVCADGNRTVGILVNGEAVDVGEALDREIEQGDSIVVWYGEDAPDGFDRELPPGYQETAPGKSV